MAENSVFDSENSSPLDVPLTRRALLALGAAAGVALTLPALPARADYPYSDIKALLFLEEVAKVQADFFTRAARSFTSEALTEHESNVLSLIAKEDAQVARWFKAAKSQQNLGSAYVFFTPNTSSSWPVPVYKFPSDSLTSRATLFSRAISIKSAAVGGYHGEVGDANDPKLIQALAALAGVQGRHLALLQEVSGQSPFVTNEAAISRFDVARSYEDYGFNREVLA